MNTTLFVRLIKPGKLEQVKQFMNECTGSKKEPYKDLLLRYGLNNAKIWFQSIDGKDYMMFIHDMDDDGMEKLQSWDSSTNPFDKWFNEKLDECFDLQNEPEQPIFFTQFDAHQ
ncbi:MAG: DUF6176 family protein [Coxiellaceae bacterium]|nr:DUF6176 family protein [Coxiellaceae bacterium]